MLNNVQINGTGSLVTGFTLASTVTAKIGVINFNNTTGSTQQVTVTTGTVETVIDVPDGVSNFSESLVVSASQSFSITAPVNVNAAVHYFELPVDEAGALNAAQTFISTLPEGTINAVASDTNTYSSNTIETKLSTKLDSSNPAISGTPIEGDYVLTGSVIDPNNGGNQYLNLTGNLTLTETLVNGQGVSLIVDGAATYVLTLPTVTWVTPQGNLAPTLIGTKDVLSFWKQQGTLYVAYTGNAGV